jgi:ribonuclease HI
MNTQSASELPHISLYCDGACLGNPGPGGYAALLIAAAGEKKIEKIVAGGEEHTTNNRMEITAALEGLRALKKPCRVTVYSDSLYVVKGMREWISDWVQRGWKTSSKKPVVNADLWQDLLDAIDTHAVQWKWVKGHAGHPENERVDALAMAEALVMKERLAKRSEKPRRPKASADSSTTKVAKKRIKKTKSTGAEP